MAYRSTKSTEHFNAVSEKLGVSQSTVLRNFVKAFNSAGGFSYDVNYPMHAEEAASIAEPDNQINSGTAKLYSSMADVWDKTDSGLQA
ncbi:MAG: hypothetical protein LBD25_08570 [Coriobacteriales bacterium]|nr:hypothetical protein [Coriobacteriales bacterium]